MMPPQRSNHELERTPKAFASRLADRCTFIFAPILIALTLGGCGIPTGWSIWLRTKRYSGDGVITTCSNLLGPGYRIDFPKFDASLPYSASYRLDGLPRICDRKPVVYLRFDGDRSLPRNTLSDAFRMTVANSRGEIIQAYGRALQLREDESYTLHLDYDNPRQAPMHVKQLFFEIDNCAFY